MYIKKFQIAQIYRSRCRYILIFMGICDILLGKNVHQLESLMHIFFVKNPLKKFAETVHHILLVFEHRVGVTVKGDRCVFMSEYLRQRFYVHTAL